MSLQSMSFNLGIAFDQVVGGYLYDHFGYESIFLLTSLISILFGVATYYKFRNYRPASLQPEVEELTQTEEVEYPITNFLRQPRYYISCFLFMLNTG